MLRVCGVFLWLSSVMVAVRYAQIAIEFGWQMSGVLGVVQTGHCDNPKEKIFSYLESARSYEYSGTSFFQMQAKLNKLNGTPGVSYL